LATTGAEQSTEAPRTSVRRTSTLSKRRTASQNGDTGAARFFLGSVASGGRPSLEKEHQTENEALIESLRTGQSYFVITEWKAMADLSKSIPRIAREAIRRDGKDIGVPAPTASATAGAAPTRSS
jgi:hypothetical protein